MADKDIPAGVDMRFISKLLYRDDVRQKHSTKQDMKQQLSKTVIGKGKALTAHPITAGMMTLMIGNHLMEARVRFKLSKPKRSLVSNVYFSLK